MFCLKKSRKILDEYEKIDYNNQAFFEVRVLWPNSSVWLERQPVTLEVTSSSLVWVAIFLLVFRRTSRKINALIAQLVEQGTENPSVDGSIPPQGTTCRCSSIGRAADL